MKQTETLARLNLVKIQATGSQAAFENAQKQFGADRTAQMAAEQQNLQADMEQRRLDSNKVNSLQSELQKDIGTARTGHWDLKGQLKPEQWLHKNKNLI